MTELSEDNFWGTLDFSNSDDPAPIARLKQQAEKLTELTRGKVEGSVKVSVENGRFFASLYAGIPGGAGYQFKILSIEFPPYFPPDDLRQLIVEDSFGGPRSLLSSMPQFDEYLKTFLSSEQVRSTIRNLVKYSSARTAS